jgi:hypothetical protein
VRVDAVNYTRVRLDVNGTFPWYLRRRCYRASSKPCPRSSQSCNIAFVGDDLVLVVVHASLIVDYLPQALVDQTTRESAARSPGRRWPMRRISADPYANFPPRSNIPHALASETAAIGGKPPNGRGITVAFFIVQPFSQRTPTMTPTSSEILVHLDFSANSQRALDYAHGLALKFGAALHLVHVCEVPSMMTPAMDAYAIAYTIGASVSAKKPRNNWSRSPPDSRTWLSRQKSCSGRRHQNR